MLVQVGAAPTLLVHENTAGSPQPPLPLRHSLMSVQVPPLPENPALQVQVKLPTVLLQSAWALQPP